MLKQTVLVGVWAAKNANTHFYPSKPRISVGKTKAKIREFFDMNAAVRELSRENKENYPRMHQSVQNTAIELVMYYIKNWGKSTATNNQIRITYSYLRRALNDSCCIATLKNHINKLLRVYKSFIRTKQRGGLGLTQQNTACIVLEIDPVVIQFEDERHNEAIRQGILSAEEQTVLGQQTKGRERKAIQGIMTARTNARRETEKRNATPSTIGHIFQSAFGDLIQRE